MYRPTRLEWRDDEACTGGNDGLPDWARWYDDPALEPRDPDCVFLLNLGGRVERAGAMCWTGQGT